MTRTRLRWSLILIGVLAFGLAWTDTAFAQSVSNTDIIRGINTVWVLMAAFLVFFMQAGFAFLESGSTTERNTVSILMKNLIDFSVGTIVFWAVGYAFMFGTGNAFIGLSNVFLIGLEDHDTLPGLVFWLFQLVFAGTAATIVSGAMAERTRFVVYLISSVLMTGLIYPIFGHWAWSDQGWLTALPFGNGFHDFAGSTVVHSVGGWAALAGAFLLGPRLGRFSKSDAREAEDFRGHSVPFATLGTFILWLGWFGFNPGSQLTVIGDNADSVGLVAANTNLAAAAGALGALGVVRLTRHKWKLTPTLNGVIGGLVAITASCNVVDQPGAVLIGLVGGMFVTLSTAWLEQAGIDDPVGAVPAHLVAGVWGTLAVGLFARDVGLLYGGGFDQLLAQGIGVVACAVWAGGASFLLFLAIKQTIGLRVSADVEVQGLDYAEHGESSYSRFKQSVEDTPSAKLPSLDSSGNIR